MKAISIERYGTHGNIKLKEVQKPALKDDKVLVNIKASSINFNTRIFTTGKPLVGRPFTGMRKPKIETPGNDIAGIVESVGKNIKRFKPGDEVFGDTAEYGFGALAEYVSLSEKAIEQKPQNISFEEAAAIPEAGLVALQALRDIRKINPEQKVLIYGASGGIGTFAVQIAKYFGTEVTGVCGTSNLDLVRSLGADHVIDYTKTDFTKSETKYDLIIAAAGYKPILLFKRALNNNGILVVTGGSMKQIFQAMLLGPLISIFGNKKLCSMTVKPNKDLKFMKDLIESGKVKPVIDRIYPLSEIEDALNYYGKGHSKGKVIITIN